jgi:dihydroneopterin aldolase
LFTIHLHNLKFYSFHGIHEEEQVLGSEYEVNIDIGINGDEKILHLHQTINYVSVYDIIKKQMDHPTPLLETLAQKIAGQIKAFDNRIKSIIICIKKINPPVIAFTGNVGVTYSISF